MKKLFIPEIGTTLVLDKDIEVKLYPEGRNLSLLNHLGYEVFYDFKNEIKLSSLGISQKLMDESRKFHNSEKIIELSNQRDRALNNDKSMFNIFKSNNNDTYYSINSKMQELYTDFYNKFLSDNSSEIFDIEYINVILPKDSILTVDRIYIRKGASDYSSVSFYIKMPDIKKKMRFWLKLEDVNRIEYC